MKAITLRAPGHFETSELPQPPAPGPGEAVVRIHRVGICGTDAHAFCGDQPFFSYPRILGHELGVEVIASGSGVKLAPGELCAVLPYLECGKCVACRRGKTNCCTGLQVLGVHVDGGMRSQMTVPGDKLFPSARLGADQLALVETLSIGAHAVGRGTPAPGENTLVLGAGPIGLGVVQFAQLAGARVLVMDLDEGRLAFCRERLGVADTLRGGDDALEQIAALTDGELPTVVFDATGSAGSMAESFRYVAHGGRLVFVGLVRADLAFHDPDFHAREMTLLGSRNALPDDFRKVIGHMEDGSLDTGPWITHRAPFGDLIAAFPELTRRESGVIKAVVEL